MTGQGRFLGTYFDQDVILRLSRGTNILAWIVLGAHGANWLFSLVQFFLQFSTGLFLDKGMTFINLVNLFMPYVLQPLPGVIYFIALQAISHMLLILLEIENNTRRANG